MDMSSRLEKEKEYIPYQDLLDKNHALEVEIQNLKTRLEEAEELRRAVSEGDLDALIIPGPQGKLIFTLDSADRAYRVLVETMNEGTATVASDGTILYCNRRFAEIVRMRPQAIVGASIYGLIESEDIHTFKALLNQMTNAGEIKLRAKNGMSVPVYLSISSLHSEGSQSAWCLVATDLTEQKKNEEIIAAERLARLIIEQAAEAIVVCDTEGKITHFSNAVPRICECDPAFQKLEDIMDFQFSEGAKTGESVLPVSNALKGFSILGVETALELKDGKKLHLLLNSESLKNSDERIIGCVVTLADITERKRAEEDLRKSEEISRQRLEEIENLYRNAPVGLCELDRELRYIRLNERLAEINGLSVAEHIGKRVRDVLPQSIANTAEPQMLRVLETGKPQLDIEIVGDTLAKPGVERSWMEQWLPITDDQGFVTGLNIVVEETTERKKMERELQESEEKYRNIIETANEGIWILDPEARIIYVNKRMAEMLRCTQEEMIGKSARIFTDQKSTEISKQNMGKRRNDINESHELKLTRKDGSSLWTLINAKSLFDKNGEFAGSMSMLTDITGRKEAEDKLKETLENLERLVKERTLQLEKAYNSLKENERELSEAQKMAHLGSWYRNLTTDKVYWSDEVYRIFGFKPQEFEVTVDAYFSHIHPEDRDCVENNLKRALIGEPYSIDYRISSASGTERIVHSQGEVVFNEKRSPIGIRGTIQDVTEQMLAIEKIKESEERIQLYLQNFRGIGTQLDGNFIPVLLHGAVEELTGYTKEDFLSGKLRWHEIVVPEDRLGLQEKAQKLKNTQGMTVRHEYRIRKKNGEIRWIHGIAQNISELGNEELYQGMMYDITDRKKAEEALEKMDKIRIKEIHHRIKNNLQVICSLLSLEAERFSDENILETLKESQNRVASMALIHEELYKGDKNDTLDFAAYLHKLTADLFSSYNLGNDNISLKMNLEDAYLDMDTAVPLGIIVNELVSNSLKHAFPAGSEGEIRISLRRNETFDSGDDISGPGQDCREKGNFQYILGVVDNGKGIPEEIEIQNAESLGLQLVNILVDQIDGCIELKRAGGTDLNIWFGNKEH